jgi:hypothetical protein
MPLTLTLTEGVIPAGQEKVAFARLSEAMIKWHGAAGNQLMIDNIVGSFHVAPRGTTFTGLQETPVAFVEWKVPAFAFATREIQLGYFAEATEIVHEMSGGRQPRNKIFVNVVHAVDGAWNFEGRAMTNAVIGAAVAAAATPVAA